MDGRSKLFLWEIQFEQQDISSFHKPYFYVESDPPKFIEQLMSSVIIY